MKSKSFCSPATPARATSAHCSRLWFLVITAVIAGAPKAGAGDAPTWMHALVNSPIPVHDEKTDAVMLYAEESVNVISAEKIKTTVRRAYKILRPNGREYGLVFASFRSPEEKISNMHGWCIPAQGKDYEVKDKEAVDASYPNIEGSELITDLRVKLLHIPAPDPGNIIGYEYEIEEQPLVLQGEWDFQSDIPVRESHYSLQLPPGWEYRASFLNYSEIKADQSGNQWHWTVRDVKALREEDDMPPMGGLAGQMVVSFFSPGASTSKVFSNWHDMGIWYWTLASGRRNASPEIKQKVAELTANLATPLDKMKALANFVRDEVRYVAIELGIGGWQPHPAADIYQHRYGDCKDKATLMGSMLQEIGINSYQVAINTERGSITPQSQAHQGFNHQILAIQLPQTVSSPSLVATIQHPKLGTLLFFDPTDEYTPFGRIRGELQANYGLLVAPEGGELIELPILPSSMNSIRRSAKLTLDLNGELQGEVQEVRVGDRASSERWRLRHVSSDKDRIKPIEDLLAGSLSNFQITRASIVNLQYPDLPFGFNYTFVADNYAKVAGDLLLVRPRVLGVKAKGIMETKEPRQFPIEFEGPVHDVDTFEITLPAGYTVDELPPPVKADFGFASYESKTEVKGTVIDYIRTFDVKELSVPVDKAEELKRFYRIIATDERNTAVFKPGR
jgi:Domain of Unknown Function with PDB structure (DUF3857)/Transglutaminase-like superfamily